MHHSEGAANLAIVVFTAVKLAPLPCCVFLMTLTHMFVRSFLDSHMCSFIHAVAHSVVVSFIELRFIHLFIHSYMSEFAHSFLHLSIMSVHPFVRAFSFTGLLGPALTIQPTHSDHQPATQRALFFFFSTMLRRVVCSTSSFLVVIIMCHHPCHLADMKHDPYPIMLSCLSDTKRRLQLGTWCKEIC